MWGFTKHIGRGTFPLGIFVPYNHTTGITEKGEVMVADTTLTGKKRTERREDRSATIFIVGKVLNIMSVLQLEPQTRLHYRRAVGEYYERTKIINRRRNGTAVVANITNQVYLVVTSFEEKEDKNKEAIRQIRCCLNSYEDIFPDHIIEVGKGKSSFEDIAIAIQNKKLPSNVIVIGDEPLFTWRNPLATSFKKNGIAVEYLGDTDLVAAFPY